MCLKTLSPLAYAPRQNGFALPVAIFTLVALGLLITAFAQLQQNASQSSGLQVNHQRAFFAAESGMQLSLNLLIPPTGSSARDCSQSPFYQLNFSDLATPGLNQCAVEVSCSEIAIDGQRYYTLVSTGRCGQGFEQARRAVEVRVL